MQPRSISRYNQGCLLLGCLLLFRTKSPSHNKRCVLSSFLTTSSSRYDTSINQPVSTINHIRQDSCRIDRMQLLGTQSAAGKRFMLFRTPAPLVPRATAPSTWVWKVKWKLPQLSGFVDRVNAIRTGVDRVNALRTGVRDIVVHRSLPRVLKSREHACVNKLHQNKVSVFCMRRNHYVQPTYKAPRTWFVAGAIFAPAWHSLHQVPCRVTWANLPLIAVLWLHLLLLLLLTDWAREACLPSKKGFQACASLFLRRRPPTWPNMLTRGCSILVKIKRRTFHYLTSCFFQPKGQ